jgi:hypothetical protein
MPRNASVVSILRLDSTYCVIWQNRNYACYERCNTELRIEIGKHTGKNRKMFSIDIQGGQKWVWAPGKIFSGSPATADRLNFFTR